MTMRSVGRPIIRTPRRSRQWAQTIINFSLVAATHAGEKAIDLLTELETDLAMNFSNITISALNFNVDYRLVNSSTGDDTTVTCAVALVGADALAAGAASLPDIAEDHGDYMFWETRTLTSSRDVTDKDEAVANSHLEIRNRSMRKMRENHQKLVMLFRSVTLGADSMQIFVGGRALILLP